MRVPARRPCLPPFKCVGGKRRLVSELLRRLPPKFGAYHERFVGGGALFFAIAPRRAFLSDSNPDLIAAYRALRDERDRLLDELRGRRRTADDYFAERDLDPAKLDGVRRAARFLYLTRCGFNGIWRTNLGGRHNVPYAGDKPGPLLTEEWGASLRAVSVALRGVEIECRDFQVGWGLYHPGDAVYFDPPYAPVSKTSNFVGYTKDGFEGDDQRRLRDHALSLKQRGVHVLITNSDAPLIRDLYSGPDWRVEEVLAARSVNSDGAKRGPVKELVIT